jgi:hypothetical protein
MIGEPLFPGQPDMAGYRKVEAESPVAAAIYAEVDLHNARVMQNPATTNIWTPEERATFAAEHPEAWAQAAREL